MQKKIIGNYASLKRIGSIDLHLTYWHDAFLFIFDI